MKIPKIIHQTWKDQKLPNDLEELSQRWQALHPDWEYRLWTDEDNRNLVASIFPEFLATYDGFQHPIQRADAARYFILYKFGGVYVDLDYLPFQNLESILAQNTLLLALEPPEHCRFHGKAFIVSNSFMATVPEDPFMHLLLQGLRDSDSRRVDANQAILESTGPMLVTRIYEQYSHQSQIMLADSRYFCPLSYLEVERWAQTEDHEMFRRKTQAAVAVHLFSGSWWKTEGIELSWIELLDRAWSVTNGPLKIPKIIHLTWKEEEVPEQCKPMLEQIRNLHPDWEIRLWTDETMLKFVTDQMPEYATCYDEFPTMIQRCDFFRLLVVYRYGGVYLDLDIMLDQSFSGLDPSVECFFPCEKIMSTASLLEHGNRDAVRVANYAFGAVPSHPFLKELIQNVATKAAPDPVVHNDVLETTGPGALTTFYHDYVAMHPETDVLLLYPLAGSDSRCGCNNYGSVASCSVGPYGSHLHMGSWR